jgi:hypothetical protein
VRIGACLSVANLEYGGSCLRPWRGREEDLTCAWCASKRYPYAMTRADRRMQGEMNDSPRSTAAIASSMSVAIARLSTNPFAPAPIAARTTESSTGAKSRFQKPAHAFDQPMMPVGQQHAPRRPVAQRLTLIVLVICFRPARKMLAMLVRLVGGRHVVTSQIYEVDARKLRNSTGTVTLLLESYGRCEPASAGRS